MLLVMLFFSLIINVISAYVIYRETKISKIYYYICYYNYVISRGVIPTYMVIRQIGIYQHTMGVNYS